MKMLECRRQNGYDMHKTTWAEADGFKARHHRNTSPDTPRVMCHL